MKSVRVLVGMASAEMKASLWLWRGVWFLSIVLALGLLFLYSWLPSDGATGDLESFLPDGYHVKWMLERRQEGLQVGDVIVRAGGYTVEEWLAGVPHTLGQQEGKAIIYTVLRNEEGDEVFLQLSPIAFGVVARRWYPQLLGALAFFLIGTLVFWKRPYDLAARLLMLFCVSVALQYWGDAFNFQFSTLLWRWPFWLHWMYEHITFSVSIATICYFALVFPTTNPVIKRYPRLAPFILYALHPLVVLATMLTAPDYCMAIARSSDASWALSIVQMLIAVGVGIHTAFNMRDPITRAQARWVLWCSTISVVLWVPGYIIPLILGLPPLIPHPVLMVLLTLVALGFAVAILRYRLFDIDIVINRTLVYCTLTGFLLGMHFLLVRGLTWGVQILSRHPDDTSLVFIATLCIALIFEPLRRQIQRFIDRVFYRRRLNYQHLLTKTIERLSTRIVRGELTALLVEELPQTLQFAGAKLSILDTKNTRFVPVLDERFPVLTMEHPLVEFLRFGRPLLRLQPSRKAQPRALHFLETHNITLSVPLMLGERLIGIYNLGPKLSGNIYSRDELRLFSLLGQQAAIAVENSRLFQTEREHRLFSDALAGAAAVVSNTLELDQVLDRILQQVEQVVGGDAFNVMLFEYDHVRVVRARGYEQFGVANQVVYQTSPIDKHPLLAEMVKTGEPIITSISDRDAADTALRDWMWMRSRISAPVQVEGQTIGALNVEGAHIDQFTELDAARLVAFAHYAATALENALLYEQAQYELAEREYAERALQRSLDELQSLQQITEAFLGSTDLTQLMSIVAERIVDTLGFDMVMVTRYFGDEEQFTGLVIHPIPARHLFDKMLDVIGYPELKTMPTNFYLSYKTGDNSYIDRVFAGEAVLTDALADLFVPWVPRSASKIGQELLDLHAFIDLPMQIQGKTLGTIIAAMRQGPILPEQQQALARVAGQAAVALENAILHERAQEEIADRKRAEEEIHQLYEEIQQRVLEQQTLRGAMLALTTTLNLEEVIDRILAHLQEVVPYDTASVQLLEHGILEIVGGRGFPNLDEIVGLCFDPQSTDNPNRQVVNTRASFIVADATVVYKEFRREPHVAAHIRSWLGIPMLIGEKLIGMIALDKKEPAFYTPTQAELAEVFAAQAAIAIENSRLFQAERDQRGLAEALVNAAVAVNSSLDLDDVLDRILEQVSHVVEGNAFNIMLRQSDYVCVVRWLGYENFDAADTIAYFTIPLAAYPKLVTMMRTGEPVVIPDVTLDADWTIIEGWGWMKSYVSAPILVEGESVGFLNVDGAYDNQFDDRDAKYLNAFASHAATAIRNAQLHRELRERAGQLELRVEQRTAELQAQYARLDAILRSTADGIIVTDDVGRIVQTNPVAKAWLRQTLSPTDVEQLKAAVQTVVAQASDDTGLMHQAITLLELTGMDLELSGAPIVEPNEKTDSLHMVEGEPSTVVAIHDVSHLKTLDRMKTQFVTDVSHELRTPVTTIKLYAHLMQQRPEKWEQYLLPLIKQADHQASLVQDIVEIANLDSGHVELQLVPTLLNELVSSAFTAYQAQAIEHDITLVYEPLEPGPTVLIDMYRMTQVLNHLLRNAVSYTPAGGTITISTGAQQKDARTWATITIADTGVGIPEEELSRLAERFFRGERPRSMQISGTGLGLAIVNAIVELHGGQQTIESEENVGTTFTVWLPLIAA